MNDTLRRRIAAAAGTGGFAFLVYLLTLAPSLDFIDAGELAAVAHTFGIAHPTGYPLFTLLAGVWSWLPLGDGIVRLNVFAALCAALGAGFFTDALWHLLGLKGVKKTGKKKAVHAAMSDSTRLIASVIGALAIAFSRTYWRTALSIEVYALHMLMLALLMWALARLLLAMQDTPSQGSVRRHIVVLALLLGLSFSNHMSTVFLLPALFVLLAVLLRQKLLSARTALTAAGSFAAGLLPYLYLPLRASAHPWLNWGNPESWERFIWHLSGKQYSVWMFSSADAWKKQFANVTSLLPGDVQYVALLAAAVGMIVLIRRNALAGAVLLLLFVTCVVWAAGYEIHDIDSYLLLALAVLGAWTATGIAAITQWLAQTMSVKFRHPAVVGVVFILPLALNAQGVSQRGNYLVEDYTKNMFASLEKHALVFSYQWDYWVSASLYYQAVENFRTDVVVLDKELFRRSWYIEQLRVNYPDVYEQSVDAIAAFEVELYKFEHDLPYDPATIEAAFNRMINSIIEKSYASRPVYVTIEMEQQFAPDFIRVPVGLAFRLYRPDEVPRYEALPFPQLQHRPFASDERLPLALPGMYGSMLLNRAVYAHRAGYYREAVPFFERAAAFVPGDSRLLQWKQRNDQALRSGRMAGDPADVPPQSGEEAEQ
ncbi:MAG: DUF2723 domain-containing protein [Bacteroidia bacterium]|nr:DUF2723 domain-containing protein [Bacteroidia bacterium]